jgi:hypothetical protein
LIYSQEEATSAATLPPSASPGQKAGAAKANAGPQASPSPSASFLTPVLWVVLGCGAIGLVLISIAFYRLRRETR